MVNRALAFDILSKADTSAADDALLLALPDADPEIAQAIVEALLLRRTPKALQGLIAQFHVLPESLRLMVLCESDDLFPILRPAAQARDERVRINAIEMIQRSKAYRAAYLLDGALHDRSAAVRESAANALYDLANELYENKPQPLKNGQLNTLSVEAIESHMLDLDAYREDRRQVVSALDAGLNTFNVHLQPKVIEAAMWYLDDLGNKLWSVASSPSCKASHAVASILQRSLTPRLAAFAFQSMSFSGFRNIVVKQLSKCTDPAFLTAWLRECWRLSQSRYTKGMVALKQLACLDDRGSILMQLPPDALRHAPRWISTTGLNEPTKSVILKALSCCGHDRVQRAAVSVMAKQTTDTALTPLYSLALETSNSLSELAKLHLAERFPEDYPIGRLIKGNVNEPGRTPTAKTASAQRADDKPEALSFGQYWSKFDELNDQDKIDLGHGMAAKASMLHPMLARKLTEEDPRYRVRAVRMITVLGQIDDFSSELQQLCHDPQADVRSAAITAVGSLQDGTSQHLVRKALSDNDTRVQANAVEAIGESKKKDVIAILMTKLSSSDNRVRANAVKVLLKLGVRQAAETLLRMLQEGNRAQRISALWLVENMGLLTLAKRVNDMAEADDDKVVRQRAEKLAAQLHVDPQEVLACPS